MQALRVSQTPLPTSLRGDTPSTGHYVMSLSGSRSSREAVCTPKDTVESLVCFSFPVPDQGENGGVVGVRHSGTRVCDGEHMKCQPHWALGTSCVQKVISSCQVSAFSSVFISGLEVWFNHSSPVIKLPLSCFTYFIYLFIPFASHSHAPSHRQTFKKKFLEREKH